MKSMNPVTSNRPPVKSAAECFPKLVPLLKYLDSLEHRADLDALKALLEELDIARTDLDQACCFSEDCYQRNIIRESPWYELVCLCWRSGQRTPIHDHRGSSCAFRVVEGTATEIRFAKTPSGLLTVTGSYEAEPGYICASFDDDIHQVLNANPRGEDVVTLHIYSPPLKNYRRYTLDSPTPVGQVEDRPLHERHVCTAD